MVKDSYFQFPLCALAYGLTIDERLNAILDYSVVAAGLSLWQKLTVEKRAEFLRGKTVSCRNPNDSNTCYSLHCAALYGAHVIGVTYKNIEWVMERYKKLQTYVAAFEKINGKDAKVRIKKDWLFKARDCQGLTYREFSVLCGLFSAIGSKELSVVTRERIRRCALGYRSAAVMSAEFPKRADLARPLTERQLRDTIERLHRNKFFARCTVSRRITYYSIRLNSEAFRKKIFEIRTYPEFFRASQSAQDQALTSAIKQKRCDVAWRFPVK